MSNRDTPLSARKRRRPALSCEQCRRRKVRCDREMPCGPCKKIQPSLACSYSREGKAILDAKSETRAVGEDGSQSHAPRAERMSLDINTAHVEEAAQLERARMLHDRIGNLEHGVSGNHNPDCRHRADDMSGIDRVVIDLENRVKELEQRSENSKRDRQPSSRRSISPVVPRLKSINGATEIFDATHWGHMFQQLHYLRDIRRAAAHAETEVSSLLRETRSMKSILKSWKVPQLDDPVPGLLNDLPGREICDQLVHHYFRTMEVIFRVLHIPSFYEGYASFWESTGSPSMAFLLKLLLILAIGSVFHAQPGPVDGLRLPVRRWIHAAQWWLFGPTSKETRNLEGLQVHCLLVLCRHVHAIDKQGTWQSAGSLLRLAMSQGLHRDPAHFPSLSPFDREMRRRIWATIIELNVQLSVDVSMPPCLALNGSDTKAPSNLNDEDFDKSFESLPSPRPKAQYTSTALQIALLDSFATRLHILQSLNDCNSEQSYEAALDCGAEIRKAINSLAGLFRGYFEQMAGSDSSPTTFHYRLLNTILHRALLSLYRPFTLKAIQDPLFYAFRKLSLDSALAIASYAESPSNPDIVLQQSIQEFHRLCLSGAGLFRGAFSEDVIVTIGLELMLQTEEALVRETTSLNQEIPDSTDQMEQYTRAPLVLALERIQSILLQSISSGIPCMKRYSIVSGILAQAKAGHHEGSNKQAVIQEAVLESMRVCRSSLQEFLAHEMDNSNTDGTLAHEGMNWSGSDDGVASGLSPGFWASELSFDPFGFWDFPLALSPTNLS